MAVQQLKRRFSVQQYHKMAEAGILSPDERVELIEGEIFEMSPIGSRHAACVNRLLQLFSRQFGQQCIVAVQNPVQLSDRSEPQPDVSLLKPRSDFYAARHPRPEEVFLLVEVADRTLEYDRDVKVPLYARSGITEVWLINLRQEQITLYQAPRCDRYNSVQILQRGEPLTIQAFQNVSIRVDEILG